MGSSAPLPTLSVVVPNYNHARYLEAALRAHLAQTAPPLEIIVVDDASTDGSPDIVERLAATHPTLRLLRLPENRGVNAAMNVGLSVARGDCVCFSAADDLVAPRFAARSLALLGEHPEAAFCFSDPAIMLGDTGIVHRQPLLLADGPTMFPPARIEQILTRGWFPFPGHAVVYRRVALLSIGGFVEDLYWYADWFANSVLALRRGACYVPETLTFVRESATSYSARGRRQPAVQRQLVYRMLELLDYPAHRDVRDAFRRAALMPELGFRVLGWLAASEQHRWFLTPRLAARVCARGTWNVLKPWLPVGIRPRIHGAVRRWARRLNSRAAQA